MWNNPRLCRISEIFVVLLVVSLFFVPFAYGASIDQQSAAEIMQDNKEGDFQLPVGLHPTDLECTIGVNHSSTTTHTGSVLWKVRDISQDVCQIVKHYQGDTYGFIAVVHWLGEEHNYIGMGLNEAGVAVGNSVVQVDYPSLENNLLRMHYILGSYGNLDQIRTFIQAGVNQEMYGMGGCFPFIDNYGNATMFELDASRAAFWEYDTLAPARASQGLLGFVVRANEFHEQELGMDDTRIKGRYLSGTLNTLGLIGADEFNEQSVVQGGNNDEYRLIRYSDNPWPISSNGSQSAMAVRGAAPGEDPALATMWAALGNPSYTIAVPTWAKVSDIPSPIATCDMYDAVYSLYRTGKIKEEWVQASVIPAEAHLFDMVNNRILPYWREVGPPAISEMTRIEHQMAQDAYSVVYYLANTGFSNLAPGVDFDYQQRARFKYMFVAKAIDADGSIASYLWNFGDGTTSTKVAPVHEFPGAGVYLVSVTTADDDAVTTTAWRYITVGGN